MPAPVDNFGELGIVIPDVPEPITGWREWTVEWDLHSPALDNREWEWPVGPDATIVSGFDLRRWEPGRPFIAQCPHSRASLTDPNRFPPYYRWDPLAVPCEACPSPTAEGHQGYGCGIYAYKALDRFYLGSPRLGNVLGRVIVYGNVWEHDAGYRASRAELTGLLVPQQLARPIPRHMLDMTGHQQQPVADYLAGMAVLAVRYRVPIFVPVNKFADGNPTGELLARSGSALRFHPPAGNMPLELVEMGPHTFLDFVRAEWGYRWGTADARLDRRERARRTLAEQLRAASTQQLTPESIARVREALGLPTDPEEDPHG